MSAAHDRWVDEQELDYQRLRLTPSQRVVDMTYAGSLSVTDRPLADADEEAALGATLPATHALRWADVSRPYAVLYRGVHVVAVGGAAVLRELRAVQEREVST